jgi:hypothetical protein
MAAAQRCRRHCGLQRSRTLLLAQAGAAAWARYHARPVHLQKARDVRGKPGALHPSASAKSSATKKLIQGDAPIAWVFDSLAAMVPRAILYDSKGKPREPDDRNMKDNLALATAVLGSIFPHWRKRPRITACAWFWCSISSAPSRA